MGNIGKALSTVQIFAGYTLAIGSHNIFAVAPSHFRGERSYVAEHSKLVEHIRNPFDELCKASSTIDFAVAAKALLETRPKKNLGNKCTRLLIF